MQNYDPTSLTHRCVYCTTKLRRDECLCHPLHSFNILCRRCAESLPLCVTCELHVTETKVTTPPQCKACRSVNYVSDTELDRLLSETSNFLSDVTDLDFRSIRHLSGIYRSSAASLSCRRTEAGYRGHTDNTLFGLCCWRGTKEKSDKSLDIFILDKLSESLTGAFLCHELIHAAILSERERQRCSNFPATIRMTMPSQPSYVLEEGLCHLAAACWLTQKITESNNVGRKYSGQETIQGKFWLRKFFYGSNPEFSSGFRWAKSAVESISWKTLIAYFAHS